MIDTRKTKKVGKWTTMNVLTNILKTKGSGRKSRRSNSRRQRRKPRIWDRRSHAKEWGDEM
jgi:hypothetical protein